MQIPLGQCAKTRCCRSGDNIATARLSLLALRMLLVFCGAHSSSSDVTNAERSGRRRQDDRMKQRCWCLRDYTTTECWSRGRVTVSPVLSRIATKASTQLGEG